MEEVRRLLDAGVPVDAVRSTVHPLCGFGRVISFGSGIVSFILHPASLTPLRSFSVHPALCSLLQDGRTAMMMAVRGDTGAVVLLLREGADLEARDNVRSSPPLLFILSTPLLLVSSTHALRHPIWKGRPAPIQHESPSKSTPLRSTPTIPSTPLLPVLPPQHRPLWTWTMFYA